MERVDDSLADLAEHFREQERAYLELLRARADAPGPLRDLLELAIWEDYGLCEAVEGFLSTIHTAELDSHLRRARSLKRLLRAPHPVDGGAPPGGGAT
jgi:hypothetical protein